MQSDSAFASYLQRTQEPLAVGGRIMRGSERGNAPRLIPRIFPDISKESRTPCARVEPPLEPSFDTQWTQWSSRSVCSHPILLLRLCTSLSKPVGSSRDQALGGLVPWRITKQSALLYSPGFD